MPSPFGILPCYPVKTHEPERFVTWKSKCVYRQPCYPNSDAIENIADSRMVFIVELFNWFDVAKVLCMISPDKDSRSKSYVFRKLFLTQELPLTLQRSISNYRVRKDDQFYFIACDCLYLGMDSYPW